MTKLEAVQAGEAIANRLLDGLPEAGQATLLAAARRTPLAVGQTLYRPDQKVDHVYFPERGLISLVVTLDDGLAVETGVVGVEGAAGLSEAMTGTQAFAALVVQAPGAAWKVPAAVCRTVFREPEIEPAFIAYAQALLNEARQSIACQAFHRLEPRLARWLLECRDRAGLGDQLNMTQEFLAVMLGVQRTSITAVMASLEAKRLVRLGRARVQLADIAGLEAVACECRRTLKNDRRRLGVAC